MEQSLEVISLISDPAVIAAALTYIGKEENKKGNIKIGYTFMVLAGLELSEAIYRLAEYIWI
jgi:hypothetical protein